MTNIKRIIVAFAVALGLILPVAMNASSASAGVGFPCSTYVSNTYNGHPRGFTGSCSTSGSYLRFRLQIKCAAVSSLSGPYTLTYGNWAYVGQSSWAYCSSTLRPYAYNYIYEMSST